LVFGWLGAEPAGLQGRRAVPRRQGRDQARLSMRDQLCYREYRSDDGDDVDDERTEDQAEDAVENIGLDRFDFGLQSQPGLAQLAEQIGDLGLQFGAQIDDLGLEFGAYLGEIRLGGELGPLRRLLHRGGDGLGLRLVKAGLAQPLRNFQRIDRHSAPSEPWHMIARPSPGRETTAWTGSIGQAAALCKGAKSAAAWFNRFLGRRNRAGRARPP
jgi:hypothetical protein